jgi:hypothetical protein
MKGIFRPAAFPLSEAEFTSPHVYVWRGKYLFVPCYIHTYIERGFP